MMPDAESLHLYCIWRMVLKLACVWADTLRLFLPVGETSTIPFSMSKEARDFSGPF
jgi:hypothetical protein